MRWAAFRCRSHHSRALSALSLVDVVDAEDEVAERQSLG